MDEISCIKMNVNFPKFYFLFRINITMQTKIPKQQQKSLHFHRKDIDCMFL